MLVYSRSAMALPQDVTCLARQLTSVYGNSITKGVERRGKYDNRWEQLAEQRFALGIFEGCEGSGEHLGIDIVENVTLVKRRAITLWWALDKGSKRSSAWATHIGDRWLNLESSLLFLRTEVPSRDVFPGEPFLTRPPYPPPPGRLHGTR